MIIRLSQPSLAVGGAGAELGNIAGLALRLISGIYHTSYSYISGICQEYFRYQVHLIYLGSISGISRVILRYISGTF